MSALLSPPAHLLRLVACLPLALALGGCYYAHVAKGQAALILQRRPVARLLADPGTDPALARRLALAQQARRYASQVLGLPDNRSYTYYVDLHRPYVVWNVFAAPRYSVVPVQHCFPFAGCVAYRGYFDQAKASAEAARLKAAGDDVLVAGVPAYSTLGWFADPILSSMLRWDDDELADTLFHELAHQLIYVKDDSAFNESFANFVGQQGLRAWRASRGLPPPDRDEQAYEDGFAALVLDLRGRLKKLYASGAGEAALAGGKRREIEDFRVRYRAWRDREWPREHGYDAWVAGPINNASLLPFGLYDQWTPAFAALFRQSQGQWQAFYARVRALAAQPRERRDASLAALAGGAGNGAGGA